MGSLDSSGSLDVGAGILTQTEGDARYVEESSLLVNVVDYGATGDGTTDDTTAIQAAITALTAGGTVYFPVGTYLISSTLTVTVDGITLRGASLASTIKVANGAITGVSTMRHMVSVTANRFRFESLTLDGNISNQTVRLGTALLQVGAENATGTAGVAAGTRYEQIIVEKSRFLNANEGHIRVYKCRYVTIRDNRCTGVTSDTSIAVFNIKIGWVWDFVIAGNYCDFGGVTRNSSNNIFVSHSGNSTSGSERGAVRDNVVADCTDSPIEVTSSTSGSALEAIVRDVVVQGNVVRNGAGIISLQSRNIIICDNIILDSGAGGGNSWGIRLGNSGSSGTTAIQRNVTVCDNTIIASSNTGPGISLLASGGIVQNVRIERNTIVDVVKASSAGIQVDGGSVASPNETTGIVVRGNVFRGVTVTLLSISGLVAQSIVRLVDNVQGSTVSGVKTATYTAVYADETVLGDPTAGAFTVNLPSAVGVHGKRFVIKNVGSANNLTVDPNGAETVDGAATLALTPGTAKVFESDGSGWRSY